MQPRFTSQNLRNFIDSTQGKSVTVAAVTILLIIVIFLLGVFPAISSIVFQVEENARREAGLAQIQQKRTALRTLAAEEADKEPVTRALNAYMPDDAFQEQIFTQLSQLVSRYNLTLVATSFGEVERRRNLSAVFRANEALKGAVLTVSFEGDVQNLEQVIGELEQSRRIYNLRNISLIRRDGSGADTIYRMDLQAEIYFWDPLS